jgi:hypothetical protein
MPRRAWNKGTGGRVLYLVLLQLFFRASCLWLVALIFLGQSHQTTRRSGPLDVLAVSPCSVSRLAIASPA